MNYKRLTNFLIEKGYERGGVDKTLFIKKDKYGIIIAQIYVDDIVLGSISNSMLDVFVNQMKNEFEMSMVGELTYFLGLQVKQINEGIFISQSKYAKNLVKKFGLGNVMCEKHQWALMINYLKMKMVFLLILHSLGA